MGILQVLYAAFSYLALLVAILWGMLFLGGDVSFPNLDAAATAPPLEGGFIDLGLLLLLALLHRSVSRGLLRHFLARSIARGLERSTQAWAAAALLALIYAAWRPLPHILWSATGPLQWALGVLFYIAWTLIVMGAFLACHLDLFDICEAAGVAPAAAADEAAHARSAAQPESKAPPPDTLRQPLYCGILIAVWATSVMTVGHLLLAAAVTGYLLLDAMGVTHRLVERHPGTPLIPGQAPRA